MPKTMKQEQTLNALAAFFANTSHFILQGKGGCGKSLKASVLTQYFQSRGCAPICGDTDPVNSTFHQIRDLNVQLVPITDGGAVVQRLFDPLFETLMTVEQVTVIDNGASTFLPIAKYISTNYVLEALQQAGKQVFIHCVVTGGQAKDDTVTGLLSMIDLVKKSKSNAKIVVWENEFWGIPEFNGKPLAEMPWFKDNSDVIQGLVKIIDRNSDAFSTDIRIMTEKHLTLRQVMDSEQFGVMSKSRLYRVFNDIYSDLDRVFNVPSE
ncbi:conjugal transfer protein, TraL family [Pseudomonas sp. A25(2017)]|uniref:conjugal transfer protein, TraL family n=1 Tax=Pseudomonas sp. A25(2017) TaxID=1945865 RepID=UPI0021157CF3|nr:conjugal transfer protein, TraL family [Pseudomonas sp. A25(2017)]